MSIALRNRREAYDQIEPRRPMQRRAYRLIVDHFERKGSEA